MEHSNSLVLPMYIRGIHQQGNEKVIDPTADYSKLPWKSPLGEPRNKNTPPLGEHIVSPPFQSGGFTLQQGVHLQWFLPDILTKPFANGRYISLPDYWIVARVDSNGMANLDNAHVIATRFLFPGDGSIMVNRSNIPIAYNPKEHPYRQPYRYQGRTVTYDDFVNNGFHPNKPTPFWMEGKVSEPLMAKGFGDPSYFSFYPDCNALTGFHDNLEWIQSEKATSVRYLVIGEIQLPEGYAHDALSDKQLLEIFQVAGLEPKTTIGLFLEKPEEALSSSVKYQIPSLALSGYIEVDLSKPGTAPQASGLSFTLGNTGTEALSAHLAFSQSGGNSQQKVIIEELLESVKFRKQLNLSVTDIRPKFIEERHRDSFMSISSGSKVIIKPISASKLKKSADNDPANTEAIFWDEKIAYTLNSINKLIEDYDKKQNDQNSQRSIIYGDWTKYITSKYTKSSTSDHYLKSILPEIVEAARLVEEEIHSLGSLITSCGLLDLGNIREGQLSALLKSPVTDGNFGLANQIYQELEKLHLLLSKRNSQWESLDMHSKPYWAPVEPLILIEGLTLKPENVGQNGDKKVVPIVFEGLPDIEPGTFELLGLLKWLSKLGLNSKIIRFLVEGLIWLINSLSIKSKIRKTKEAEQRGKIVRVLESVVKQFQQKPGSLKINDHWNPFILDWEVEYLPAFTKQDIFAQPEILKRQFDLKENRVALEPLSITPQQPIKFSGRTWLSASVAFHQSQQLETLFKFELGATWEQFLASPSTLTISDFVDKDANADMVLNIQQLLTIYNVIKDKIYLTQSLSGFNEQMLMHQTILQPQLVDPLGDVKEIDFSDVINTIVGNTGRHAPVPQAELQPLRAGNLRLTKIRLIDNWGRFSDVLQGELATVVAPETLTSIMLLSGPNEVGLPPRISQPARLSFTFLGSVHVPGLKEYTKEDVNIASPICGWLQSNHLDDSLMIFDENGTAIGSLDQNMHVNPPPGVDPPPVIRNIHLKRVVDYLQSHDKAYLQNFMSASDAALAQIAPLPTGDPPGLALFVGRPMAVVRSQLRFELKGLPAIDESWEAFEELRKDRAFNRSAWANNIKLPVRIGEHLRMKDGLIGFWQEGLDRKLISDFFVSAPAAAINGIGLQTNYLNKSIQWLNFNQTAQFTMLIDPRAGIHATSGVLPVEQIHLSPKEYTEALKRMYIWFYSGPNLAQAVMSPGKNHQSQVRMCLPKEAGWAWSWISKESNGGWVEVSGDQLLPPVENAELDTHLDLREGWLVLKQKL